MLEPLKGLSKTYDIDTIKGHFPHHFNISENQDYVGTIPKESDFGTMNMTSEAYEKEFSQWYASQMFRTDWSFKVEMNLFIILKPLVCLESTRIYIHLNDLFYDISIKYIRSFHF